MDKREHARLFAEKAVRRPSARNDLRESANAGAVNVGIVGGGLIGVALAVALREHGATVTVLERGRLGGEASSSAGGILGAQTESTPQAPPLALLLAARAAAIDWAERLEHDGHGPTGLSRRGVVKLAFDDAALAELATLARWHAEHGATAQMVSAAQLAELVPGSSPELRGGLFFADDAHLEPALYVAAAVAHARALGVTLCEDTPVRACGADGAGGFIDADARRMLFDRVVVAAGSWSTALLPAGSLDVKPIRGQMIELRVPERPFGPVVIGAGVYSIPRADGRVVLGSTMEDVGHRRGVDAAGMHTLLTGALRSVPALAPAEFVRTWSSFRPHSPGGLVAGPTEVPALYAFTGHHRNGILLARETALRLAAQLLAS